MKTVFNSQQTVHVWASQTQVEGRNSTRSIFFLGPSIYSYGHHFEMARFVEGDTGWVVLITTRSYSPTTSRHLSYVRGSVSQYDLFTVPSFTDHKHNITGLIEVVRHEKARLERARLHLSFYGMGVALTAVKEYYQAFRSKLTTVELEKSLARDLRDILSDNYLSDEWMADYKAREATAEAERGRKAALRAAAWRERKRRAEIEEQAELEKWKAGESTQHYFSATALRIVGNTVQTTKGAEVPVIEARMLYRMLKAGRDIVGRRVGHFTVSQVTETDVHIGCHVIPMSEVDRIGALLLAEPETVGV